MRKNLKSSVLIALGSLMVAAAVILALYNLLEDKNADARAKAVTDSIALSIESETGTPQYLLNPEMDMPVKEIDGYMYIGTVEIPSLELKLPVMDTWSYPLLKISPCRYAGSAYLKNMVIAAHNYDSHFGQIKNLLPGDEIIFTDMASNVFRYEVAQSEILKKTDVNEMTSGGWALTLFTCTLDGRTRVTVRCTEIE